MKITAGYYTHQGRVRDSNQDFVTVVPPKTGFFGQGGNWLIVLADGMGGYHGGEIASQLAVETLVQVFGQKSRSNPASALIEAVQAANKAVAERAQAEIDLHAMGTTLVAATVVNDQVYISNVGDSRGYLIRGEESAQLTLDHSLVSESHRAGLITDEELETAGQRNIITRALGREARVEIDTFEQVWQPGDAILLCCDGLWGVLSDAQIAMVVSELAPQPAAEKLVEMAMNAQSTDNISAVIMKRLD
jgi:protein phosphatase